MKLQVCKKCNECGLSDRNSIICLFRQDFLKKFHPLSSINYLFWLRMTEDEMIMKNYGWNSDRKYRWLGLLCFFLVERSLLRCWGITKFSRWGFHSALFTKTFSICSESIFMCATISRWVCQPIQSWCVGHFLKLT